MAVFEAESVLKATAKIVVKHEGEVNNINQEKLVDSMRTAIVELVNDEAGADDLPINVSIYVSTFTYGDNLDTIRRSIQERLAELDAEELHTLMETMNNV